MSLSMHLVYRHYEASAIASTKSLLLQRHFLPVMALDARMHGHSKVHFIEEATGR